MRKQFSVALIAGLLSLAGMTEDAAATVTISLEWGACGGGALCVAGPPGPTIIVNPGGGQTLRLDIFLWHDEPGGITAHRFSINFDTDLLNELNLGAMAGVEWAGTDLDPSVGVNLYQPVDGAPSIVESQTGGPAGRLNTFESSTLVGVLPANSTVYSVGTFTGTVPARYRVGQVFFALNAVGLPDGADVFSGLFAGPDAILDSLGSPLPGASLSFGTAEVSLLVPEPGTVSLLGLGLVGLVLASRRRRS